MLWSLTAWLLILLLPTDLGHVALLYAFASYKVNQNNTYLTEL